MAERKSRKNPHDVLDIDEPEHFMIAEPEPIEIASGYSISVKYDEDGRPLIYVKKYGEVDIRGLRREIEKNYPGASIQGIEKLALPEVADVPKKSRKPHPNQPRKTKRI